MASTDAKPFPIKNTAYRVTFSLLDADGDLVTGAAGLDSEVSKDGGTFADCTNEATEIATSSGMYYLDLTSTEMNADTVAIIVKTSTSGAKTTPIVLYPQEAADIKVDVTHWNGTAIPGVDTAGYPKVTVKDGTGTGEIDTAGGKVLLADGAITAAVLAADAITAAKVAADVTTEIQSGLATAAALATVNAYVDELESRLTATRAGYLDSLNSGVPLSAGAVDAVLDEVVEGSLTMRQLLRIVLAALAGESGGGGTTTITFRDQADSKNRISATVDASRNRTAVTVDGS